MVKKNPLMSTQKIAEHSRISTITKNKEAILIRSPDLAIFVLLDGQNQLLLLLVHVQSTYGCNYANVPLDCGRTIKSFLSSNCDQLP